MRPLIVLVICLVGFDALADDLWTTTDGATSFTLSPDALRSIGIEVLGSTKATEAGPTPSQLSYGIASRRTAVLTTTGTSVTRVDGAVHHIGALVLSVRERVLRLNDMTAVMSGTAANRRWLFAPAKSAEPVTDAVFSASAVGTTVVGAPAVMLLANTPLQLTERGAILLGIPQAAGSTLGFVAIRVMLLPGKVPATTAPLRPLLPPAPVGTPVGADLTFCSLDGFRLIGQRGDIAAFSAGTTSWNVGTEKLDWWAPPDDWRHPYIVLNLYRVKNGLFEQLGASAVKHGFYAASAEMCGSCDTSIEGGQLPVGCTDTYNVWTNAEQGYLGPRFEIDPWAGYWERERPDGWRAHLLTEHDHNDVVEHLMQAKNADLDPAQNVGATYWVEGLYLHYQDVNVMNNAAYKPLQYVQGAPGGAPWLFRTDDLKPPIIGFALDQWDATKTTLVAQQVPVVKPTAPDGRAHLAVKVTDLGGGRWRYAYVLLNIDMARQIGSLRISVPPDIEIADPYFHAPHNTEERLNTPGGLPIDDLPWTFLRTATDVRWDSRTNPLRWGTAYTFAFTSNRPPTDIPGVVGLFTAGKPAELNVMTIGPSAP